MKLKLQVQRGVEVYSVLTKEYEPLENVIAAYTDRFGQYGDAQIISRLLLLERRGYVNNTRVNARKNGDSMPISCWRQDPEKGAPKLDDLVE